MPVNPEILLATTDEDVLHQISVSTWELRSTTNLQNPSYPTLDAISIAANNILQCTVMGKDGWYAIVDTRTAQPVVIQFWHSELGVHALKQGPYSLVGTGGYKPLNGVEVVTANAFRPADVEASAPCRLIYTVSYHTSRAAVYYYDPAGFVSQLLAGEIQDKKAPAEIMVSEAPINVTAIDENRFLLAAGYLSHKIDIIDISNIENICVSIYHSPCPPEHGYLGVAHTVDTRPHPQTVVCNAAQDKAYVLSENYVEVFAFDAVAKTLTKTFEFPHSLTIAPIYGVNQMAVTGNGARSFVLGNGIIRVFNNANGEVLQDISYGRYTSLLIV